MDANKEGIVLHSASDLINAIRGMMMQMNRKQRKGFLTWVKERRNEYDFRFPQGYVHKDAPNDQTTAVQPSVDVPVAESVPALIVPEPGIVNPAGEVVSSQDQGTGAVA